MLAELVVEAVEAVGETVMEAKVELEALGLNSVAAELVVAAGLSVPSVLAELEALMGATEERRIKMEILGRKDTSLCICCLLRMLNSTNLAPVETAPPTAPTAVVEAVAAELVVLAETVAVPPTTLIAPEAVVAAVAASPVLEEPVAPGRMVTTLLVAAEEADLAEAAEAAAEAILVKWVLVEAVEAVAAWMITVTAVAPA